MLFCSYSAMCTEQVQRKKTFEESGYTHRHVPLNHSKPAPRPLEWDQSQVQIPSSFHEHSSKLLLKAAVSCGSLRVGPVGHSVCTDPSLLLWSPTVNRTTNRRSAPLRHCFLSLSLSRSHSLWNVTIEWAWSERDPVLSHIPSYFRAP